MNKLRKNPNILGRKDEQHQGKMNHTITDLYNIKQIQSNNCTSSCSEDDSLSRSDFSFDSSLSDRIQSLNTSLSEEFDFNFGFDSISDDDDEET
ncbi:unnamed protein product [Rotaria sordida]|uniref:Uncharacterized protein n=1 Tax=Rotaria sordida TaxID=392033 RepID=A0A815J0I3_9BILA|nr:unnamed protein product [Rotaria sordida]CAF1613823.1 unnamed protein product [Rotaria sordida]